MYNETMIDKLTQTKRRDLILIMRENGETYQEIAIVFGLTRERIRQIIGSRRYRPWRVKYDKVLEGRDAKREEIREYFDYTCQMCGKKWKEGERRLDVHHLSCESEDSRRYDKDVDLETVTVLCHRCHMNLPEHREAMRGKRKKVSG